MKRISPIFLALFVAGCIIDQRPANTAPEPAGSASASAAAAASTAPSASAAPTGSVAPSASAAPSASPPKPSPHEPLLKSAPAPSAAHS